MEERARMRREPGVATIGVDTSLPRQGRTDGDWWIGILDDMWSGGSRLDAVAIIAMLAAWAWGMGFSIVSEFI